jgi:8-oxo-dGTP pyrophosphatase MutT (NUDIX family)
MPSLIATVTQIEARLEDWRWHWSENNREVIAAHWQTLSANNENIFDGTVLLMHRGALKGDLYQSGYFKTPYSHFMALRDLGVPDPSVRNGFSCAALKTQDGAYLLGIMAEHTSNACKIYFAAGTPDLEDCHGDRVDIEGSALREMQEETGFSSDDVQQEGRITLVDEGFRVAFLCHMTLKMTAQSALERFAQWNSRQTAPELAGLHVVRSKADLRPAQMHPYLLDWFATVLP